jgi:hypothetical protein
MKFDHVKRREFITLLGGRFGVAVEPNCPLFYWRWFNEEAILRSRLLD